MHRDDLADRYLKTVIDTVPDVLFVQDAAGRIVTANDATARVLGQPCENLVGRLHREVSTQPDDVRRLEEQINVVLTTGEPSTIERSIYHPVTGAVHWFETRVVPLIPPDGGPMQALVVGTDHTERRSAEEALKVSQQEILVRLAQAAEYRDDDTGKHTQRVGQLSAEIAGLLGFPDEDVQLIREAAPLHDLGKIGVPDSILLKPGPLTESEYAVIQRHTIIGGRILSGGSSDLMTLAEEIALAHHEKWDGSGYPRGQREDESHAVARVVCVADVIDALSHDRPYRNAWSTSEVIGHIREGRGTMFDPLCVDACLEILDAGLYRPEMVNV